MWRAPGRLSNPKTKYLDPAGVRRLLITNARPLCEEHSRTTDGLGELNLSNDNKCVRPSCKAPKVTDKFKTPPVGSGVGSLEAARGSDPLPCMTSDSIRVNRGTKVPGTARYEGGLCSALYSQRASVEVDIHGHPIKTRGAGGLADREKNRNAWTVDANGGWHWMDGAAWFGSPMTVAGRPQWPTKQWGNDWTGVRWSTGDWSGTRWSGTRWSGTRWSGTRWSNALFRDHSWG